MSRFAAVVFLATIFMAAARPASAEERVSTPADQEEVAVTIYNDNLALIKDRRRLVLPEGASVLAFREVSGQLRPETALLRSMSHPDALRVIEQNFDFDLLTPAKLLEKYVGRAVKVVKTHPATGEETLEKAEVLSANNGVVLRIGDRIETGVPGRLVFPDLPANLRHRPTLVMNLTSATGDEQVIELSYLSGGLSWQADYVAELNPSETGLALNGWVTLTNTSGAPYRRANLQLVAGDVHRVSPAGRWPQPREMKTLAAVAPDEMAEEGLFEYHLYTLERPTTILDNQTKQVALLQANGVECGKEYLLAGNGYYYRNRLEQPEATEKIAVYLYFRNTEETNLGLPLPKGVVRVYKQDSRGRVQFVGEDRIDHTPEHRTVRLRLGNAFDVTADRRQTDFRKLAGFGRYNYVFETAYTIELRNAKDEPVVVRIVERLPGDWDILEENREHHRESASTAVWEVPVEAGGNAMLSYRAKVRF